MNSSETTTKIKFSIGGIITMGFSFFKNKKFKNRYRRKPIYLFNNSLASDWYYFTILNKLN